MIPSDPTARFLPTLQRARAAELPLPPGEPRAQERWAALFVIATILRRKTWTEERLEHPSRIAHIGRGAPAVPEGFAPGSWITIEGEPRPGIRCPDCMASPGWRNCRICHGTRTIESGSHTLQCSCGVGRVACPMCLANATVSSVVFRYFEDQPRSMRELVMPSHLRCYAGLFRLEASMEGAACFGLEPPEELRCHDLSGRKGGSAYRGGERITRPTFHGHDYGDAIDGSLAAMKALAGGGSVVRYEVRAYAWPLLRLTYENSKDPAQPREFAVYPDRTGKLCLFGE